MAISGGLAIAFLVGLTAATTAVTVRQQNMAGKRSATIQGQQAQAQAQQVELQALAERTQAESDELDRQRTLERIMSAQNAVFGATGLASTGGSFANLQTADASRAAESTRLNQVFNDTRQVGLSGVASGIRNQASINRSAAKFSRRTNSIRGFSSIISTGASAF